MTTTEQQMVELLRELHFLERQEATIASKLADLEDGWRYTLKLIRFQILYCRRCCDLERPELVERAGAILASEGPAEFTPTDWSAAWTPDPA